MKPIISTNGEQKSNQLQVINGINSKVYFDIVGTDHFPPSEDLIFMDNIFAIQFATTSIEYPVFNIQDTSPVFFSSTKNLNAGIIQFITNAVDIFGAFGLERVDDQHIYYLPRCVIELFSPSREEQLLQKLYNKPQLKAFLELRNLFLTMPQFTIIADQQPLVFVSRFFAEQVSIKNPEAMSNGI